MCSTLISRRYRVTYGPTHQTQHSTLVAAKQDLTIAMKHWHK